MGSTKGFAPNRASQAAVEYVNANYGCSQLSAAVAANLGKNLDYGMRAVHQAVRSNLIRVTFTGARNRLWPAGITLTRVVRDLRCGDWFVDPHREGRKLARVARIGKRTGGRAFFILTDETDRGPWVDSYDLRERVEIG